MKKRDVVKIEAVFAESGFPGVIALYNRPKRKSFSIIRLLEFANDKAYAIIDDDERTIIIEKSPGLFRIYQWIIIYDGFITYTVTEEGGKLDIPKGMGVSMCALAMLEAIYHLAMRKDKTVSDLRIVLQNHQDSHERYLVALARSRKRD